MPVDDSLPYGGSSIEHDDLRSAHMAHLAWVLTAYGINVVFDVGANVGQFGSALRGIGYREWIVSFEPIDVYWRLLERNAANDSKWRTHNVALGRTRRTVPMYVSPGTGSSMFMPNSYGMELFSDLREIRKEEMSVLPLSDVDEDFGPFVTARRIFLKIDTQGYDLEVFAGAGRYLPDIAVVQSEVSLLNIYDGVPSMTESIDAFQQAGFYVTGMFPVSREQETGRVLEFDCVMVRPSLLAP
jgi:FkbM family methyltransferase